MIRCNIEFPNKHTDSIELPIPPCIGMTISYLGDTFKIQEIILNDSDILLKMDHGKNKSQKADTTGITFNRAN